MQTETGVVVD